MYSSAIPIITEIPLSLTFSGIHLFDLLYWLPATKFCASKLYSSPTIRMLTQLKKPFGRKQNNS